MDPEHQTPTDQVNIRTSDTSVDVPTGGEPQLVTSSTIVNTVIFTLAALTVFYVVGLFTLIFMQVPGSENLTIHFTTAGTTLLGALVGSLMKTSAQQAPPKQ